MYIKQNFKKILKESDFVKNLYLRFFNKKEINFYRQNLYKYKYTPKIIDKGNILFHKNLPNNLEKIDNQTISQNINSVIGWIPFVPNRTSAVIYNFFSQNYSIRKNLLLRLSLILKGEIVHQRLIWIKPNLILEIDNELIDYNDDAETLILELFNPRLPRNHGGQDGHFRFWGKYYDNKKNYLSTSHSMPLNFNLNFLKNEKLGRSYFEQGLFKNLVVQNYYMKSKKIIKKNTRVDKFGYALIFDEYINPVSVWHLAGKNENINNLIDLNQVVWCPKFDLIDPYILLDEYETGLSEQDLEIFIIKNQTIIKNKSIKFKGSFFKKISEIFDERVEGPYYIFIKFKSIGHSYFHIYYNNKFNLGDQVHAHDTAWSIEKNKLVSNKIKENGNTRKFFHISNNYHKEKNYLILNIDKISDKKELNINLRFLTDKGFEQIKQLKINFEQPLYIKNINEIFENFEDIVYKCGVVQIESLDHNINGSMLSISKENIAVDHLTGG